MWPHLPDVAEEHVPRAWSAYAIDALVHQSPKMEEAIDDEQLIWFNAEVIGADRLPLGRDAAEPERDATLTSKGTEPASSLLNPSSRTEPWLREANEGDPHLRWSFVPGLRAPEAKQGWPVEPVMLAIIDNVQLLPPTSDSLADG